VGLLIPEDVAVVGYGDIDVSAYLSPALTTMAVPYEEIARAAMDLMLRQIGGQDAAEQVTLRSRLIVRESCGEDRA
jgi:LacI family transcriptional regulator